jgi:hypothetical protein
VPSPESIQRLTTHIRDSIAREGNCIATAGEIAALGDDWRLEQQFRLLALVTRSENWTFTYLPDGRVQIAPWQGDSAEGEP